jgi:putative solute:sodium symporter small subunit
MTPPQPSHAPLHMAVQRLGGAPALQPGVSARHHTRHLRLKAVLLLLWLLVTFVTSYFARDLQMLVGGWTLGYWMAAQGAVLVFIAIVVAYAWGMSYFERQDTAASHD